MLKFCKYFPCFGLKPIVVTVTKNPSRKIDPKRNALLREVADHTEIHYVAESRFVRFMENLSIRKKKLKRLRSRSFRYRLLYVKYWILKGILRGFYHFARKRFVIPDEGRFWNRKAVKTCRSLIQQKKIKILLTTSPLNSTHLIGKALKKNFDLVWCADFRDAWVGSGLFHTPFWYRNLLERNQERGVLKHADIVTSMNDYIVELLKGHTPDPENKRFATIYNGYDPDELDAPPISYDNRFLNLIHAGALGTDRNMGVFLGALMDMVREGKPFRIWLLGRVLEPHCIRFGRENPDHVKVAGIADRATTIGMIKGADACVLVNSAIHFQALAAKIFEYLGCDKRVIGLVPEDIQKEFIQTYDMGWCCSMDDEKQIKQILHDVHTAWEKGELGVHYPDEVKKKFDRKNLAGQMAQLLLSQ